MGDKVTLENGGTLRFAPGCYRNQRTCIKDVHNYAHELEFVLDCYKTQKMCNKAVDTYSSEIQFVSDQYKIHKMCDKRLILVLMYMTLILIDVRLKKSVIKLFPKNLLC